jgi:hypothetical protein
MKLLAPLVALLDYLLSMKLLAPLVALLDYQLSHTIELTYLKGSLTQGHGGS